MQINELSPDVWIELGSREVSDPRTVAAEAVRWANEPDPYACVFVSQDSSCHFLVSIGEVREFDFSGLRGLSAQILRDHAVSGRPRQDYLDLRCTAASYLVPFTRVVQDVAILILRDGLEPITSLERVADSWRAFWAPPARPPLSEPEQRGLIGELIVLRALAEEGVAAANCWAGPDQDRHDFRSSTWAIEVKTTLGLPRVHQINGLDQLVPSPSIPLCLVSVLLDRAGDGPVTLPSAVASVLEVLGPEEREVFRSKLASTGYSPVHEPDYRRNTYVLGEIRCYDISADFPHLDRASFRDPVPAAITSVSYTLNVESLPFTSFQNLRESIGR